MFSQSTSHQFYFCERYLYYLFLILLTILKLNYIADFYFNMDVSKLSKVLEYLSYPHSSVEDDTVLSKLHTHIHKHVQAIGPLESKCKTIRYFYCTLPMQQ